MSAFSSASSLRASSDLPVFSPDQVAQQLASGFFGTTLSWDLSADRTLTYGFGSSVSAGEKALARMALAEWAPLLNVRFVQASNPDIRFSNAGSEAYTSYTLSGDTITHVDVTIGAAWYKYYGTTVGTYSFQTYLHELGHAFGLGHPGEYNGTGEYPDDASFANDSWQMSVMSYFSQDENGTVGADYAYVLTPMLADVRALRLIYGETEVHAGATVYGAGSTAGGTLDRMINTASWQPTAFTLVDSGGRDLLDLSPTLVGQRIDLTPGKSSDVNGVRGAMVIATGTIIENLYTGAGNDVISGNGAANRIRSGDGSDRVTGGGGNDVLFGQDGFDTLDGGSGNDRIYGGSHADRPYGGTGNDTVDGGAGSDTIRAGDGDDFVRGGSGDDVVYLERGADRFEDGYKDGDDMVRCGTGNDVCIGTDGDNRFYGGEGNDRLVGGREADRIWGGGGNDTINGGKGNDRLAGNLGADTFVFGDASGSDTVTDFDPTDLLDVRAVTGLDGWSDIRAGMSAVSNGISLHFAKTTILLVDVDIKDLAASDFLF